jgi:hypothetical protein
VNISTLLKTICGGDDFTYVACPDFSISLRQRRLILGLPIGGYVNWSSYDVFPLELDVNSCGVHIVRLLSPFSESGFREKLHSLQTQMDKKEFRVSDKTLKWNFSRRNHFINVYQDNNGSHYVVFHSSGETILFDWESLHRLFSVKQVTIEGRSVPYINGQDAQRYQSIAEEENGFFLQRHDKIFKYLFADQYELIFADQHFGMVGKGEILMGCSKVRPGSVFPILTRPFEKLLWARVQSVPEDVLKITGGYALVPHGLGMTIPEGVVDILPDTEKSDCVIVLHRNGSRMVTDTLEYVGIDYRHLSVLPEMQERGGFVVEQEFMPVLCTKL